VEWHVGFYAFDPLFGKSRRKKIKLNHIEKIKNRREYARDLIIRLTEKLRRGWNPIAEEDGKGYSTFTEVDTTTE